MMKAETQADSGVAGTRIRLLGPPEISRDGERLPFGLQRGWALLTLLALNSAGLTRQRLIGWLWPDDGPERARGKLRRTLHALRQAIGRDVIQVHGETVRLVRDSEGFVCDVLELRASGASTAAPAPVTPVGELLEGLDLPELEEFEEWLAWQRESFRALSREALLRESETAARGRRWLEAEELARRGVSLDSLDEAFHRVVLRSLIARGRFHDAREHLERLRRRLRDELGLAPESATLALVEEASPTSAPRTSLFEVPEVHYLLHDGVHLAYQVLGEGPVDVIFVPGFISHLEQGWARGGPGPFLENLATQVRIVLFDRRGVGLSDRLGLEPSVDATVADLEAVRVATGLEKPVIAGLSEGGPAAIRWAAQHRESAGGLFLYGTTACGSRKPDHPWSLTEAQFDHWEKELVAQWGRPASLAAFAPSAVNDPMIAGWWSRMLRMGASPGGVRAILRSFRDVDVREDLSRVTVPTWVVHREGDRAVPAAAGRFLSRSIPGARWRPVPGEDHWWWIGETPPVLDAFEELLDTLRATSDL